MIGMETVIGLGIMAAALLLVVLVQAVLLSSMNRKNKRLITTNTGLYNQLIASRESADGLAATLERKLEAVSRVADIVADTNLPKSDKARLLGELRQC